ncbi:MAG: SURF1 family protein [Burkholderiales bacterium]|nr:SURF1 family protein [Burkholderiales bacterium]
MIATLLFVALTVRLGLWQLHKGQARSALQAEQLAADHRPAVAWQGDMAQVVWQSRVSVTGQWDAAHIVYLDNRLYQDRPGYHVLAPLVLANGSVLPVMYGWIPRAQGAPSVTLPTGPVTLTVRLQPPAQHYLELSGQTVAGRLWQNLSWPRYTALIGKAPLPVLAYQLDGRGDVVRDWPEQGVGADRNFMYAGQWFLFAAVAAFMFIKLHLRKSAS